MDIATVLAAIERDAGIEAAMDGPGWRYELGCVFGPPGGGMLCGGIGQRNGWGIVQTRNRYPLYIALARAVLAERAAHAEIMANLESRTVPHQELYNAHDVAAEAVESALAALALPTPEKPTP